MPIVGMIACHGSIITYRLVGNYVVPLRGAQPSLPWVAHLPAAFLASAGRSTYRARRLVLVYAHLLAVAQPAIKNEKRGQFYI